MARNRRIKSAAPARKQNPSTALVAPQEVVTLSEVMTVDELADAMRLDRKTVYGLIARGELPGVGRVGRSIRIHREAVLRWLADGRGVALRQGRTR